MAISKNDLRAERLQKLRDSLKAELSRRGLTSLTYSDATLLGVPVKALHFQEIKTDIDKIKPKLYEKATGEQVKDESISSLELIVTKLANSPKVGGSTSCSGGCIGLCVSSCFGTCTATCTGSCQGCQGCTSCSGTCGGCSGCGGACQSSCAWGCRGCHGCTSCSGTCGGVCASYSANK